MKQFVRDLSPHPVNIEIYGQPDDKLKDSLKQDGQLYPIEVDPEGRILSGARRWKAAQALGLEEVETRVIPVKSEAEATRRILLANHYRDVKTPYTQKKEADKWLFLQRNDKVDKSEMVRMAEEKHGQPLEKPEDLTPARLAARVAGMSPTVYGEVNYVTEPDRAEKEIDRAREKQEISVADSRKLKTDLRSFREDVVHDRVPATSAAKEVRGRIRTAKRRHGYTEDERRAQDVDHKVKMVVRNGERFAAAIRALLHAADARYLTHRHAFQISAVFQEIEDAKNALVEKATGNRDVGQEVEAKTTIRQIR